MAPHSAETEEKRKSATRSGVAGNDKRKEGSV